MLNFGLQPGEGVVSDLRKPCGHVMDDGGSSRTDVGLSPTCASGTNISDNCHRKKHLNRNYLMEVKGSFIVNNLL